MKGLRVLTAMSLIALSFLDVTIGQAGPPDQRREEKRSVGSLHLYGPGGPQGPMRECAHMFSEKTGVAVSVTTGTPPQWIEQAKQDGDLIYEGAEFMLNDFMQAYPGIVDEASITGLYARSTAIIVRKGNPKRIGGLGDLIEQGIKIVVVTQEKMEEVYGRLSGIQYNIVKPLLTGAEAARIWKTMPELDAWITYESWHHALKDETDLVQIPDRERVLRITPVAMIKTSRNKRLVLEFIDFLRSDEAHKIFQKSGWK